MTKIDETTGLAALPEDMFWRVEESTVDSVWGDSKSVGGVKVRLIRKTVKVIPRTEEIREVPNGFWRRVFTGKAYTEQIHITLGSTTTSESSVSFRDLVKYANEVPKGETDWTEYTSYDGWETEQKFYRVIPPTPENLLESSVLVWEHYINLQHGKAIEENLKRDLDNSLTSVLGDYPPKSINTLVNA